MATDKDQEQGQQAKPRWKKTGHGSFRMADGRIIKENQTFSATPEEIPKAFRDCIVPVDGAETKEPEAAPIESVSPEYTKVERDDGSFDVVTAARKILNEQPLTEEEADTLIKELS